MTGAGTTVLAPGSLSTVETPPFADVAVRGWPAARQPGLAGLEQRQHPPRADGVGAPRSRIVNHGTFSATGDDLLWGGECCDAVGGLVHNAVGRRRSSRAAASASRRRAGRRLRERRRGVGVERVTGAPGRRRRRRTRRLGQLRRQRRGRRRRALRRRRVRPGRRVLHRQRGALRRRSRRGRPCDVDGGERLRAVGRLADGRGWGDALRHLHVERRRDDRGSARPCWRRGSSSTVETPPFRPGRGPRRPGARQPGVAGLEERQHPPGADGRRSAAEPDRQSRHLLGDRRRHRVGRRVLRRRRRARAQRASAGRSSRKAAPGSRRCRPQASRTTATRRRRAGRSRFWAAEAATGTSARAASAAPGAGWCASTAASSTSRPPRSPGNVELLGGVVDAIGPRRLRPSRAISRSRAARSPADGLVDAGRGAALERGRDDGPRHDAPHVDGVDGRRHGAVRAVAVRGGRLVENHGSLLWSAGQHPPGTDGCRSAAQPDRQPRHVLGDGRRHALGRRVLRRGRRARPQRGRRHVLEGRRRRHDEHPGARVRQRRHRRGELGHRSRSEATSPTTRRRRRPCRAAGTSSPPRSSGTARPSRATMPTSSWTGRARRSRTRAAPTRSRPSSARPRTARSRCWVPRRSPSEPSSRTVERSRSTTRARSSSSPSSPIPASFGARAPPPRRW